MSRIHEALKKAAEERAGSQPSGVTSTIDSAIPSASNGGGTLSTPDVLGDTVLLPAHQTDYLRLDELQAHCTHPRWRPNPDANVFTGGTQNAHVAEQFRTLRSRLYQMRNSQTLQTLLVTSSVPSEGKTFVTNNLAQALVRQPDRRVLIIDADLRCPRLHKVLGAPGTPGLLDYLSGTADDMAIVQQGPEERLWFIPAGDTVTNPSELLSNGKLKTLLDHLKPLFDWVILDSPPCLPVADASVLSNLCDGVLLVVRAESTPSATAQKACQEMEGKNVVGVVLNGGKESISYGSNYYYQGPHSSNGE